MTTPRPVQTDRDFYYDSTSDLCPLTPWERDAVPVGTVAARIMELRNLAKVSTFNVSPSPISRHPESSRIGFGRRVDSRFGKPASRSCKPNEDTQEDTKHSFLGLNTHRSNHMEAHAFVDGRVKCNRTAGLRQQLQPSGLEGAIQYQRTTSSDNLPKGDFRRESPLIYKEETERIKDSCPKSQSNIIIPKLSLPNLPYCVTPQVSIKQEEPLKASFPESRQYQSTDQQKAPTAPESQSFEKASTLRQQSLRDLYYYYGIHRPAGLVMSQKVTFGLEDTPRSLSKHESCQACSCTIAVCAMNCTSGVSLCEECQSLSPAAMTTSDGSDESMENKAKCKSEHLQKGKPIAQPLDTKTRKGNSCEQPSSLLEGLPDRGGLRHLDEKDRFQYAEVESNSIVRKLPLLRFEEATHCCGSLESSRRDTQLPDSSQVYQQTDSAEVLHSVKDTTSDSKVDTILSTRAPNIVTISTQLSNLNIQSLHHGHHQQQESHRSRGLYSDSSSKDERGSGNDSCGSSGCPATDQGCLPYRHSITCGRKRRRYPEETDSGYVAGASHLEEPEMLRRDIDQKPRYGNGIQGHHLPRKEHPSPNQNACASLVGETRFHEDKQSIHQTSYAKHTVCSSSVATRAESVPYAQQQLSPKVERRNSTKKASAWTLDIPQSRNLQEKESKNQYDNKTADNSCDCTRCRKEHHIQPYTTEIVHATNHFKRENTHSRQYLMPRSTTPVLASVESALVGPECLSKSAPSCPITTIPGAKIYTEKESSDRLTDSPKMPSHDTANQEISISKDQPKPASQDRFREIGRENFMELPLHPSVNMNGVRATNFDSLTNAVIQDSLDTLAPTPGIAAEVDQPTQCVNLRTDLTTDMAQSIPIHTPGDLSPSKFKPTSRRLSAFFKLQEQNVVSILNKRLQDHQEALKRAETICNDRVSDRINAAIQSLSLDREQDHELDIERSVTRLESLRGNTTGKYELDLPGPMPQLGQQGAKVDRLGTEELEEGQNSTFKLTHMIDRGEEHNCAWKQIVMKRNNGVAQNPNLCSENNMALTRDKASDVGINGITIVIHLEGRESVIIKADLSQGI